MLKLISEKSLIYLVTAPRKYKYLNSLNIHIPYKIHNPGWKDLSVIFQANSPGEMKEIMGSAEIYKLDLKEIEENTRLPEETPFHFQDPDLPPDLRYTGCTFSIILRDNYEQFRDWLKHLKRRYGYFCIYQVKTNLPYFHNIIC